MASFEFEWVRGNHRGLRSPLYFRRMKWLLDFKSSIRKVD